MKDMIVIINRKRLVLPFLIALSILTCYCVYSYRRHLVTQATVKIREQESKFVIRDVPTTEKAIALTFDDGPDPEYTPEILAILKKNHVNATFFVLGKQLEKYPKLAQNIITNGNEIGNHTYSHVPLNRVSKAKIENELERTHQLIINKCQTTPTLLRPPWGFYTDSIFDVARNNGYKIILWSWRSDTRDWSRPGTNYIIKKVLKTAKNGSIIMFHDSGGDRSQTVKALQPIIKGLKKQGFVIVTVSQLIKKSNNSKAVNQP